MHVTLMCACLPVSFRSKAYFPLLPPQPVLLHQSSRPRGFDALDKMASDADMLDFGDDYDAWYKKMRAILERKTLWLFCTPFHRRCFPLQTGREKSLEAALIICDKVKARLLLRVPSDDRLHASFLLEHLARLLRPFRFLDLSPELRLHLFDLQYPNRMFHALDGSDHELAHTGDEFPAVASVSRQIRAEFLHYFIPTRHLALTLPFCKDDKSALRMSDMVKAWAKGPAKAYIRHIRAVRLCIYTREECDITFSKKTGLRIKLVEPTHREDDAKMIELREYIQSIEAERQVLSLKGEAIVLALIRDPKVWVWEAAA